MKFITAFLIIINLFHFSSKAQFKFKSDIDFRYYSDSLNKFLKIAPPDFTKTDFELRFYVRRFSNYPSQLFVFKHLLAGSWELSAYQFCSYHMTDFSELIKDDLKLSNSWKSRWDSLTTNHVLLLPTDSKVIKRWLAATHAVVAIADGVAYRFELLTKNRKRRYWYSNPEAQLQEMGTGYPEFSDAIKIIRILDNELGFKEKPLAECK
jgi:hypothetical protein